MIRRAKAGEFNGHVIAAYASARLTRRPREFEDLVDLAEDHGVEYWYHKSPRFDLNTAAGRQVARILAANDAATAEITGELVERAALQRAERGLPHGGGRRYGFPCTCKVRDEDRTHEHPSAEQIADEVAIIKEITARVIAGESTRGIARDLIAQGVPAPRGGKWGAQTVKDLVRRPANPGLVERHGAVMVDRDGRPVASATPGILDYEQWRTAVAVLTDPARGTFRGRLPVSLLAGAAGECYCGGPVRSGARGTYVGRDCNHLKRARHRLGCPGGSECGCRGVDAVVTRYVLSVLAREGVSFQQGAGKAAVDNSAKAAVVRRQLEGLEDKLADDLLTPASYRRQRDRKLAELAELDREERVTRLPGVMVGVSAATWADLPLDRQRAVVQYLCRVRLVPYGPDDPSGVGVEIIPLVG
jgi:DNA invertase Pin-like site-specific DNA recombinase